MESQHSFVIIYTPVGTILSRLLNKSLSDTMRYWIQQRNSNIFKCHHCRSVCCIPEGKVFTLESGRIIFPINPPEQLPAIQAIILFCSKDCFSRYIDIISTPEGVIKEELIIQLRALYNTLSE